MRKYQDFRNEIKYPLEKYEYILFHDFLKNSSISLSKQYEDRLVQSIYFDNVELDNFNNHVSGIGEREKIRIRWYSKNLSKLFFEIKKKKNKLSKKIIIEIDNINKYDPEKAYDLKKIINNSKELKNFIKSKSLIPNLYTKFERSYYTYLDIRLTVDKKMQYKRFSNIRNLNFTNSPVYCVIEIKSDLKFKDQVNIISKALNFRTFRHSKYIIGLNSVLNY